MRPKGTTKHDYSDIKEVKLEDGSIYWTRPCPICKREVKHISIISVKDCHRNKRKCNKCGSWNRGLTTKTSESLKKMAEESSKRMKEFRKTNPPWNKGLTQENNEIIRWMTENHIGFKHSEETKRIIGECSKNFWKNPEYREKVVEKVKKYYENPENVNKLRYIMESLGCWTPLENKTEWERYKQLVWYYTNQNDLSVLDGYDKRGRIEITGSYSLDHKYSIYKGFENKILPEIIGSIHNLEFIPAFENDSKKSKCSITKKKLMELYNDTRKNKV